MNVHGGNMFPLFGTLLDASTSAAAQDEGGGEVGVLCLVLSEASHQTLW